MKQIGAVIDQAKRSGLKPQSSERRLPVVTLGESPKAKQELATMLFQCFQGLKLYGKEPEALEALVGMFQIVLDGYTMDQIRRAFALHLRRSNEMPAPADIANIVERGNRPPFERAVYVNLGRKPPEDRTSDEWAYMRDYEADRLAG